METILYVDDEPINLRLFATNLKRDFRVLTAGSAISGLEILNKNPEISVVVSDMRMPSMNGLDFIKTAREKHPDIKYFILTGFDITKEIAEALKSKLILEYFSKPFKTNEIIDAINSNLKTSK